jgi:hypothetical protein
VFELGDGSPTAYSAAAVTPGSTGTLRLDHAENGFFGDVEEISLRIREIGEVTSRPI